MILALYWHLLYLKVRPSFCHALKIRELSACHFGSVKEFYAETLVKADFNSGARFASVNPPPVAGACPPNTVPAPALLFIIVGSPVGD